jgi:hypothetical protein
MLEDRRPVQRSSHGGSFTPATSIEGLGADEEIRSL